MAPWIPLLCISRYELIPVSSFLLLATKNLGSVKCSPIQTMQPMRPPKGNKGCECQKEKQYSQTELEHPAHRRTFVVANLQVSLPNMKKSELQNLSFNFDEWGR